MVAASYTYPALVERDEDNRFVVSFRAVPEALTDGASLEEALAEAEDALVAALSGYVDDARRPKPLPKASRARRGEYLIAVPPLVAAKLALHQAMRNQQITGAALAKRLAMAETAVRRLLDLGHRSHMDQVSKALAELGWRLEVRVLEHA